MKHDPDADLVRQSKGGNKAAFGKLASRYYEMVYGLAYGVLTNREAARDVAQDVFLKVFRDLHKFDERSKFKTWLYRVSVNAAIDARRRQRPSESIDMTDASDEEDRAPVVLTDTAPGPSDRASQSEVRDLVRNSLEKLSAEHRAVLVLREWQGLSYEEIAEALDVEVGTVMSRLYYARKKLGEILSSEVKE